MPQDAFTISYIARELEAALVGGRISRVVQPERDLLTFIIYTAKGNVKLEACLSAQSARLSLSDSRRETPVSAPNFCMLLRKHLQNALITRVVQPDFERIVYFDLDCTSDFSSSSMRLYFEIMGKYSNAVLTENGIIVGALKTAPLGENAKRVLFGGVKYVPPEPQDKVSPLDLEKLEAAFVAPRGDGAKFLCDRVKGISYATALEIISLYGESFTARDVYNYVTDGKISPCVIYKDGEACDFAVRSSAEEKKNYSTLLEAQSAFYDYITAKKKFGFEKSKLQNALSAAVKKLEKRLALIREKLRECDGAEDIKLKGELITANIYAIERGATVLNAVNYYDPDGKTVKINLDYSLTPAQNAQRYYKKYAKLKRTIASVTPQLEETEQRLDYLNSIGAHICAAESISDLIETEEEMNGLGLVKNVQSGRKKSSPPSFRTYSYGGFKIIAGRNNVQNERLTKGLAQGDTWLHTQKYHSSHVGIIAEGREIPDGVLLVAAEICAYFSDGRGGNKIPVDYTKKKYVKKPPKSNTGFVVYTDYETILVEPNAHRELSGDKNE